MNKIAVLIFVFTLNLSFSQVNVDVNTYSTTELIQDVLIGNPNFPVSNIISNTGTDYGKDNGLAYFSCNNNELLLDNGIVLVTGDALEIANTNETDLNSGDWQGDSDLENLFGITGTKDATSIQFDFTADISKISIDFLFASEDYGQFECAFADRFAFILKNNSSNTAVNLAKVPNTNIDITTLSVRGGATSGCNPENETFFDRYNYITNSPHNPNEIDRTQSFIDFDGQTKVFSLDADLQIGNSYTLKIVVTDDVDYFYNSALFVKGSSFGAFPVFEQEPLDLVVADNDNNGSSEFNLRDNETIMLGSVNTSIYSFEFTYYTSLSDATSKMNPIINPTNYTNTIEAEEIFLRMENPYTGKFITNSFRIATDNASLSIEDIFKENFSIYPNPIDQDLFVHYRKPETGTLTIYSINGEKLFTEEINQVKSSKITMDNFKPGVYLLEINTNKINVIKKVVKN